MKKLIKISALLFCLIMILPVFVSAAAYETYTYSIDGTRLSSPDAYTPNMQYDSKKMKLPETLVNPTDIIVDKELNVYIADQGASCIYCLDSAYQYKFTIKGFVNDMGVDDSLNGCRGLYVTDDYIYVADTDNNRIVLFDLEGNYVRHIEQPQGDIFGDNAIYKPVALAVDKSNRIYVVSSTTYQGIISLDSDGLFQGFIGAQKVTYNVWQVFWRNFQTQKQRDMTEQLISTEYNNITIDEKGFVYVTTSSIDDGAQQASTWDKTDTYAPVKKLSPGGKDVLGRNGFWGPGGEVSVNYSTTLSDITGASRIVDVALGPAGSWSIIDEKRSKIYTYDAYGNLLFIFGDKGAMLGNAQKVTALTYQGSTILLLDSTAKTVTTYTRTDYGDTLIQALQDEIDRNYDAAVENYQDILKRNSNFDAAYIGIGKAYYRQSKYEDAMAMYKCAYETTNYANAFKMKRQQWANKYFIIIPIVVIVLLFAIAKFFEHAAKVNKATAISKEKRTFAQELWYAFHLIFHPFDGFWDLKHEKRGSVRAALVYLVLAVVAVTYQSIGRAYILNPRASYGSIFTSVLSLVVPVILWTTANWCLTTLFDGEGSFKDIFIMTCYSLVPLILLIIPATALTNVLAGGSETQIYTLLCGLAWVWVGILIFCGTMVTHDYPMFKNILTIIGTIVAAAFVMFCAVLFSSLLVKMVSFISGIVTEIAFRL